MTVFLPRENLFFLEEWLCYHIAIGFDHFYLYDNAGSRWLDCGNSLEVTERNKRGEAIYRLLADQTDQQIERRLDLLLSPFVHHGYVTRIRWQPRDAQGQITYGQADAFMDFARTHAAESDWVSFTDIDEFLVPGRHPSVPELLEDVDRDGVTYLTLPQKCFASRFDDDGAPVRSVIGISRCADWVTTDFGRKSLIRTDTLSIPWKKSAYSIHSPTVSKRKSRKLLDPALLRFNHYKFNQWELDWVAKNLDRPLALDQVDTSLSRMASRLEAVRRAVAG